MNRKPLYRLTAEIYKRLNDPDFSIKVKKYKNYRGFCWKGDKRIELDYRDPIVPTLIHEMIHDIHQDWPEKKVLKAEEKFSEMLSPKQVAMLLIGLGYALLRSHTKS